MVRRVATRSQRRTEKRQAVVLLALVLVVALASFLLGMMVGRSRSGPAEVVSAVQPMRLPVSPPAATAPVVEGAGGGPVDEGLTFYDSLPKGGQTPLGSGINLPPAKVEVPTATATIEPAKAVVETAASTATATTPPTKPVVASPPAVKPPPAVSTAAGDYLVQAAAFRRSEDARALRQKLVQKGYKSFVEETHLGDKGIWFRVYVGPFAASDAADAAVGRLKSEEKLSGLVRKR